MSLIRCKRLRSGRNGRLGFTLVELLVVIAIIALLLAMLLPALSKAVRSARSIGCQNNLRQIAMWGLLYAQNFNQFLPINGDYPPGGAPANPSYVPTGWYTFTVVNWPGLTWGASGFWIPRPGLNIGYTGTSVLPGSADDGLPYGTVLHCPEAVASVEIRPACNG